MIQDVYKEMQDVDENKARSFIFSHFELKSIVLFENALNQWIFFTEKETPTEILGCAHIEKSDVTIKITHLYTTKTKYIKWIVDDIHRFMQNTVNTWSNFFANMFQSIHIEYDITKENFKDVKQGEKIISALNKILKEKGFIILSEKQTKKN